MIFYTYISLRGVAKDKQYYLQRKRYYYALIFTRQISPVYMYDSAKSGQNVVNITFVNQTFVNTNWVISPREFMLALWSN
jgi:hypothetical protein